jgi:hypothetical protein
MEHYLRQQQSQTLQAHARQHQAPPLQQNEAKENKYVMPYEAKETITMEEFKNYVKRWFDTDNYVKRAQQIIKEKRKEKNQLSEVIMKFMNKYNIEDLNTKEGRIRCKNVYVKAPVSKDVVKQCISDYFPNDEGKKEEIIHKIYENREKVEKKTLRRLKIS